LCPFCHSIEALGLYPITARVLFMPNRLRTDRPIERNQGPIIDLFGDTARTRIWNFLTLYAISSEYNKSEIARNSYVSWRSFNRVWPEIEKAGLLIEKKVGQSRLYRLNMKKLASQLMVKLADETAFQAATASLTPAERVPLLRSRDDVIMTGKSKSLRDQILVARGEVSKKELESWLRNRSKKIW